MAIGGITLERAAEVMDAGADSVAVISDILRAENPGKRARQYIDLLDKRRFRYCGAERLSMADTHARLRHRTSLSAAKAALCAPSGLFDGTMIVVGSMIGSGIFIVAADISRQTGSAGGLLLTWIITGLLTISAALSYGELAALFPHAGGQYIYLREAYSPLWGFLYGWTLFLVIQTGTIAAVAIGFARYLGVLAPAISPQAWMVHPHRAFFEIRHQLVGAATGRRADDYFPDVPQHARRATGKD